MKFPAYGALRALAARPRPSFLSGVEERLGVLLFSFALLVASGLTVVAGETAAGDLVIESAWSRATPDGARVAGGYLVIRNQGATPDRLVAISSPIAERGEVHEMGVDDKGVMTMRPLPDGLAIPAGETVELKPGSYHLMFMGLKERPKEGESFTATLTFEKAGEATVAFEVTGMGGGHSAHGAHGG